MPEYLHPGVYIEEIEPGPRPIEGVPTSTAAFLGETERGTLKPRLVTSYKEYECWFGGTFGETKFLPSVLSGFFENGGQRVYICRLVGPKATPAEAAFGSYVVRAIGPGSWARRVWACIDDSTTKVPGAGANPRPGTDEYKQAVGKHKLESIGASAGALIYNFNDENAP